MVIKRRTFFLGLLLLVGVLLILSPQLENKIVEHNVQQNLTKINEGAIQANEQKKVSYDFNNITPISINDAIEASTENLPIIGEIKVPSVQVDLPIIKGISRGSLAAGAATMKAKEEMGKGNYALASHHMKNPNVLFGPLDHVKVGDLVYLSNGKKTYSYRVIKKQVIQATDVQVIADQKGQTLVTLLTCHDAGKDRLMVVGKLVE